nr:MAG TPA: hypothetical protein [Caudoviricetes sp.]DAJ27364.1 MAG TPA: hypothetical protein [Caudoviricetes sp.]
MHYWSICPLRGDGRVLAQRIGILGLYIAGSSCLLY